MNRVSTRAAGGVAPLRMALRAQTDMNDEGRRPPPFFFNMQVAVFVRVLLG